MWSEIANSSQRRKGWVHASLNWQERNHLHLGYKSCCVLAAADYGKYRLSPWSRPIVQITPQAFVDLFVLVEIPLTLEELTKWYVPIKISIIVTSIVISDWCSKRLKRRLKFKVCYLMSWWARFSHGSPRKPAKTIKQCAKVHDWCSATSSTSERRLNETE